MLLTEQQLIRTNVSPHYFFISGKIQEQQKKEAGENERTRKVINFITDELEGVKEKLVS